MAKTLHTHTHTAKDHWVHQAEMICLLYLQLKFAQESVCICEISPLSDKKWLHKGVRSCKFLVWDAAQIKNGENVLKCFEK